MFNPAKCDPQLLEIVDRVSAQLLAQTNHLRPTDLMLLGAHCRNLLHDALGHQFLLRATEDLDIAFAIAGWETYAEIVDGLPKLGGTGIRYEVGGIPTDLVPFGGIEDPIGVVPDPPDRDLSVWAFQEVFNGALTLHLPSVGQIKIPSIPGYCALKLAAWIDRSMRDEYKDAGDIAAVLFWYTNSSQVSDRLYSDGNAGFDVLETFEMDESLSAAFLLGRDVAQHIGSERVHELILRWPGARASELPRWMNLPGSPPEWTAKPSRRSALLDAMQQGWSNYLTSDNLTTNGTARDPDKTCR
jgi:predicted nucleotidyltransferase